MRDRGTRQFACKLSVFPELVGRNERGYRFLTLTGFEAVVVEAIRDLQQRGVAAIEQRDRHIARLEDRLVAVETRDDAERLARLAAENRHLRETIGELQTHVDRNAELEARLAALEAVLLDGPELAGTGQ